jgi:hypothetical protein
LIRYSQGYDFRVMLGIVSLAVQSSVVEYHQGGSEVDYLLTIDYGGLLILVSLSRAHSCGPPNHILEGSFCVAATDPIHPLKLGLGVFWLLEVVLMQGL